MVNIPIILVFVVSQFISITAKKKKLFIDTLWITKRRSELFQMCLRSLKEEFKTYQAQGYDQGSNMQSVQKSQARSALSKRTTSVFIDETIEEFYPEEFTKSVATDDGGILYSIEFKEAIETIKKQYLTGQFQDVGAIEVQIVEIINEFDNSGNFKKFHDKKPHFRNEVNSSINSLGSSLYDVNDESDER